MKTKIQYLVIYAATFVCALVLIETAWIGAKYLTEGEVIHTCLDHFIAFCGATYVARDCMKLRSRVGNKRHSL